jgi:GrpB-like predicted nucleotidyltransferase (UPF0157 family)
VSIALVGAVLISLIALGADQGGDWTRRAMGGQAGIVEGPAYLYLAEYDPEWPHRFAELAVQLRAAMRGLSVEIEHVGSTSVPGLAAKPMLDVDIVVQTTADVGAAVNCLERAGYRAKGTRGVPGREAFDQPPGAPVHALYVVVQGSKPHLDHMLFRDLLCRRPDLAARYESVKRANADRLPADWLGYSDAKADLPALSKRMACSTDGVRPLMIAPSTISTPTRSARRLAAIGGDGPDPSVSDG